MEGECLVGTTCRLVPVELEEADAWVEANRRRGARPAAPRSAAVAVARRAIAGWQASWRELGPLRHWGIRPLDDGRLLGAVSVEDAGDGQRAVRLECLVFRPYRRRGLALAASRLALDYAVKELGATHATMRVDETNLGALAVARRLGATSVSSDPSTPRHAHLVTRLDLKYAV
jgi:RimJ/RimL family protein N-acetyltransferase